MSLAWIKLDGDEMLQGETMERAADDRWWTCVCLFFAVGKRGKEGINAYQSIRFDLLTFHSICIVLIRLWKHVTIFRFFANDIDADNNRSVTGDFQSNMDTTLDMVDDKRIMRKWRRGVGRIWSFPGAAISGKRGGEKKRERRGQGRRKGARGIREKAETSQ